MSQHDLPREDDYEGNFDREDRHPSASVSALTGRYWEPGERTISLFELGVRLGVYLDVRDAIADLGRHYRIGEAG